MENSNSQTQPASPEPTTGQTVEEMKAQLQAEFEKTREGLIRDLQQERAKRQELEQRVSAPASSAAPKEDVPADELGRVLAPYITPMQRALESTQAELVRYQQDKAMSFLSSKTGKSTEDIDKDTVLQDKLIKMAQKWGLRGNAFEVATRAYELMELEDLRVKEADRARAVTASQHASMPSGTPPTPVSKGKEYSAEEFSGLPLKDFEELSSKGSFRKNASGGFVFTPRS